MASFIVDTELDVIDPDDGLTSLREAMLAAAANDELDVIQFDISLAGEIIQLDGSLGALAVAADDYVLLLGDINGDGVADITIEANGSSIFTVGVGADFALSDVILTGDIYGAAAYSGSVRKGGTGADGTDGKSSDPSKGDGLPGEHGTDAQDGQYLAGVPGGAGEHALGAIYNEGNLTIDRVIFVDIHASGSAGGDGTSHSGGDGGDGGTGGDGADGVRPAVNYGANGGAGGHGGDGGDGRDGAVGGNGGSGGMAVTAIFNAATGDVFGYDNAFVRLTAVGGDGGDGGDGGNGGTGGDGGNGGQGGDGVDAVDPSGSQPFEYGYAGDGGNGGNGGIGGDGANGGDGGNGGSAFGAIYNLGTLSLYDGHILSTSAEAGTGGIGGDAGIGGLGGTGGLGGSGGFAPTRRYGKTGTNGADGTDGADGIKGGSDGSGGLSNDIILTTGAGSDEFLLGTSSNGFFLISALGSRSVYEGDAGEETEITFVIDFYGEAGVGGEVDLDLLVTGSEVSSNLTSEADDFVAGFLTSQTLVFAPGETQKTVSLTIAGDMYIEGDEIVRAVISGPSTGLELGYSTSATFTILDDDGGSDGDDGRFGSATGDRIEVFDGYNDVSGGDGDDWIFGGNSTDTFRGQAGNDELYGYGGSDFLRGGEGDDLLDGGEGGDWAVYLDAPGGVTVDLSISGTPQDTGGAGSDTLISIEHVQGSGYDDVLTGNAEANTLFGAQGDDTMTGGAGNDLYYIDSAGDTVTELEDEGFDMVWFSLDWNIFPIPFANVEAFALYGSARELIGDGRDNILNANAGQNSRLFGNAGDDTLIGGAMNDRLYGEAGDDEMRGGLGDDFYRVEDAGDTVIEVADEGTDKVLAKIDYTLAANVENLKLTGTATIGTGNDLDNDIEAGNQGATLSGLAGDDKLTGSNNDDTLDGGTENDVLRAQRGNDTLIGGEGDDNLFGDGGDDDLFGGIGEDFLRGGNGEDYLSGGENDDELNGDNDDDELFGDAGVDRLFGGAGNDQLTGGADRDVMFGQSGADTFIFNEGDMAGLRLGTADQIKDFSQGEGDIIDLSGLDAILGGSDDAFDFIGNTAFSGTAGELRWEYDGSNTMIYMDIDGDMNADYAIRLDGTINLAEADFIL